MREPEEGDKWGQGDEKERDSDTREGKFNRKDSVMGAERRLDSKRAEWWGCEGAKMKEGGWEDERWWVTAVMKDIQCLKVGGWGCP